MNFRQTVKLSHFEGGLYALMVASTESFLFYYVVRQNVSALELAVLSTVPLFLGALAQFFLPRLISEKHLGAGIVWAIIIQIIGVSGILYNVASRFNYFSMLFFVCIHFIGGLLTNPLWIDWAARMIPKRNFRKYMAGRSSYTWYLILFFYLSMALLAQYTSWFKLVYIFAIGAVARLCSLGLQTLIIRGEFSSKLKAQAIANSKREEHHTSHEMPKDLKQYIKTFMIWTAIFKFGTNVCSPFFVPYMLDDLKLSMLHYVILSSIPFFGRALFFNRWGKAGKSYAAFFGIQLTMLYIAFTPLVWIMTRSYFALICLEIISGIAWGGYELNQVLMIQNFVDNSMKEGSRVLLGIHMALSNFFGVLGAITGALFLEAKFTFYEVFWVSSGLRFFLAFVLIYKASSMRKSDFTAKHVRTYLRNLLPHT